MLRRSVEIASLVLFLGLVGVPQRLLAVEQNPPQNVSATATQPDSLPLRLEIHLSQRKVILYRGDSKVKSYWIAVGRKGWETPTGTFKVMQLIRNPAWAHPLKDGVVIPGGDPENPLGRFWIGFWTNGKNWIGFHGTPTPKSVGTAASHGCIRMYNQDITELFPQITLGTPVVVVN